MEIIVVCRCSNTDLVPRDRVDQLLQALQDQGMAAESVDDLCGLAVSNPAPLASMLDGQQVHIVACYPRAVRALLQRMGIVDTALFTFSNLRTQTSSDIMDELIHAPTVASSPEPPEITAYKDLGDQWIPWYPLIDGDRCSRCGDCVSFCLFGVYERDSNGTVRVVHPRNCKTNCPACSRICPKAAIMFPKYDEQPMNGDVVDEAAFEESRREAEKIRSSLGQNAYELLARHRSNRSSTPDQPD